MMHGPAVGLSVCSWDYWYPCRGDGLERRLYGIIALPLLALFVVAKPSVFLLYAAFLLATYAIIQFIHRRTLVYGRVLVSRSRHCCVAVTSLPRC